MHRRCGKLLTITALGLGTLGFAAQGSRADHEILVSEAGGPTIPIVDDGPLDTNTIDPGVIDVNTGALNSLLTFFRFSDLGSESNRLLGTAFTTDPATLSMTGTVLRTTLSGTFTITIQAYDTDFLFPAGNPKSMRNSASDTFRFTTAGDVGTFQSVFDPSNTSPPGPGIASPLLAFVPPIGDGPFTSSNPGVDTPLGAQPLPFGISSTTMITLGPGSGNATAQRVQFTGATVISDVSSNAVPEPSAVGLFAIGLGLVALGRSRSIRCKDPDHRTGDPAAVDAARPRLDAE